MMRSGPAILWLTLAVAGGDVAHAGPPSSPISIVEQSSTHVRLRYDGQPRDGGSSAHCLIGLPPLGEIELSLVDGDGHSVSTGPPGAAQPPARLGEPFLLRRQRTVPLTFGPSDGPVVVDIRWPRPAETAAAAVRSRWEEQFYRRALLNDDQSGVWRLPRPVSSKRAGSLGGSERIRITVRQSGIYQLTGRDLAAAGAANLGVPTDGLRMTYGGGRALRLSGSVPSGVSMSEVAIVVDDGGDGSFDADDAILFYGEAPERWERGAGNSYSWRQNLYTRDNVYWLELDGADGGRRVTESEGGLLAESPWRSRRYVDHLHIEEERFIQHSLFGVSSGFEWYDEQFRGEMKEFVVDLDRGVEPLPGTLTVRFWGTTGGRHQVDVNWNGESVGRIDFSGDGVRAFTFPTSGAVSGENRLILSHQDSRETRLDWFELTYPRLLASRDDRDVIFDWTDARDLAFDSGEGASDVGEFHLTGYAERPRIFDISTHNTVREIVNVEYDSSSGDVIFQEQFSGALSGAPRYLATTRLRQPTGIAIDVDGDLKEPGNGADYIIITHADFRDAAERLASWRAADDRHGVPMKTAVVDVADIYDEFSGGLYDPSAARSFIKYAVDNWETPPFFILLMGDGTYDHKNNSGTSHPAWIPAYQNGVNGFDEWFVRIEGEYELPDLAIGRLPVQSSAEAEGLVDKIITYDREPEIGPWQARALLIADDDAPNSTDWLFVPDAEALAMRMPLTVDLIKLYLGNFPLEGRTKPAVRNEFINRFNDGAVILNYVGHGNPDALAHEQMFVLSRDLSAIDNGRRLPLVYTAASQVGVFDNPQRRSLPERFLNSSDGGVIGFISATRVGVHGPNMVLAQRFHAEMYGKGESVPVGLALTVAKQMPEPVEGMREIMQRYSLLGDPATRLALPSRGITVELSNRMSPLEEVTLAGQILDASGQPDAEFDGTAWINVFDSSEFTTIETVLYRRLGSPIFRSLAAVEDGRFKATFRVPRDVTYYGRRGRASVYARNSGRDISAFGSVEGIQFVPSSESVEDGSGPLIELRFRGQRDVNGVIEIPGRASLTASLEDEIGINITGDIGHHIELTVDDELFRVTDAFSNRNGDYRRGTIEYDLPALAPGPHTIALRAWDNANNSSRTEIEVVASELKAVSQALFYPNPLRRGGGHMTYVLEAETRSVTVGLYTLTGRLIAELEGPSAPGFNRVAWDAEGVANGSYIYAVRFELASGNMREQTGIIQIIR